MSASPHKRLAGHQRRTLRSIRGRLLAMSSVWDGVDQYNMSALCDLAEEVEKVAAEMVPDDVMEQDER